MYIYKMVYANLNEFTDEEREELKDIIHDTDYGTTEILADDIQNLEEVFEDKAKEMREILCDRLGSDVVEALEKNDLDLVLCIWE